jgi:cytochrome c oxidase subunit 4
VSEHASKRKTYLKVFGILIVLTVLEVGIVYIPGLARGLLVIGLVGLALAKAAAVALYFMHLKEETKWLKFTVGVPLLVFPPLYALVLIFEAIGRHLS